MHGCDTPAILSLAQSADRIDRSLPAQIEADSSDAPISWALHTPPLRYEVASLEHWLDLNA
jgi:hypothetical protein